MTELMHRMEMTLFTFIRVSYGEFRVVTPESVWIRAKLLDVTARAGFMKMR